MEAAIINYYSAQYKHIVIFGDFIMSIENCHFQILMQIYDLSPLIKEPTCFQSHNPTCMDNFLRNQKRCSSQVDYFKLANQIIIN